MLRTLICKEHPELLALVRAVDPAYRKHKLYFDVCPDVRLSLTYWSDGTRYTYSAVNLATRKVGQAPQYDPPQFGGPSTVPTVAIPPGAAIVRTGIESGKQATAYVRIGPQDAAKLLEQGKVPA